MTDATHELTVLTVGQVAERYGVTVRTLHHYDELGLLSPSERRRAGYRLYTDDDLTRLQHIVVYRRLGFPLETIAQLLDGGAVVVEHLRRQRAAVMTRLDEMQDLVAAIDRALEREEGREPHPGGAARAVRRGLQRRVRRRGRGALGRHRPVAPVPGADLPLHEGGLAGGQGRERRRQRGSRRRDGGRAAADVELARYVREAIHANADRAAR